GEATRVLGDPGGDLVIGDQRTGRSVPGAEQADRNPSSVHRSDREIDRELLGWDFLPGPALKRLEHLMLHEPQRRVLHPDVDRHGGILTSSGGPVTVASPSAWKRQRFSVVDRVSVSLVTRDTS